MEEVFVHADIPREELILATVEQLKKELSTEGFDLNFSGNAGSAYSELMNQLEPLALQLLSQPQQLFRLMYRMDVTENRLKAALASQDEIKALADLLIRRCLEKVVWRKMMK